MKQYKVKLFEVHTEPSYSGSGSGYYDDLDELVVDSATEWETITQNEYDKLTSYIVSKNSTNRGNCTQLLLVTEASLKLVIEKSIQYHLAALEKEKKLEEKKKKQNEAYEKKRKEAKKKRDLKKLEKLKALYEKSKDDQ